LNILHLSTSCSFNSAVYRLHSSLINEGVNSKILTLTSDIHDTQVIKMEKVSDIVFAKIGNKIDKLSLNKYKYRSSPFSSSLVSYSSTLKYINEINPDIVVLHWINAGFLSIDQLSQINKPLVWCLHDMWSFTGGCHYNEDCLSYQISCGNCKVLESNDYNDLSNTIIRKKESFYSNIKNFTIIGLSKWMATSAKQSFLLHKHKVVNIPNPININIFDKFNNNEALKKKFHFNKNKKLILFGAVGALRDRRKGFKELVTALENINSSDFELVVFGNDSESLIKVDFEITYLGYIKDFKKLIELYNVVEVMIVPSLQENLSNAIMESLSCGTPVVAFDIGGNADMIDHKQNGYLAKPYDTKDLANGIEFVLNNDNYEQLSKNARDKVVNNFESSFVAKKYINLYQNILERK
jgi:glycosyltransferase involved in cell wall biosynthesis